MDLVVSLALLVVLISVALYALRFLLWLIRPLLVLALLVLGFVWLSQL
ncbi:MAG: hypothetical protein ACO4AU_05315 [bacterium]